MFATISFLIAIPCLLKGGIALVAPERFYTWRRTTQYGSENIPRIVLVLPIFVAVLAALSWYATITDYQPWSWLVTGFTTLIAVIAAINLTRWSSHRRKVGTMIETQPEKRVAMDRVLVVLGLLFLGLAIFVFP